MRGRHAERHLRVRRHPVRNVHRPAGLRWRKPRPALMASLTKSPTPSTGMGSAGSRSGFVPERRSGRARLAHAEDPGVAEAVGCAGAPRTRESTGRRRTGFRSAERAYRSDRTRGGRDSPAYGAFRTQRGGGPGGHRTEHQGAGRGDRLVAHGDVANRRPGGARGGGVGIAGDDGAGKGAGVKRSAPAVN